MVSPEYEENSVEVVGELIWDMIERAKGEQKF